MKTKKSFFINAVFSIFILSFIQCTTTGTQKEKENDLKKEELFGKVKMIKTTYFNAIHQDDKITKLEESEWQETLYDEFGYITETTYYYLEEDYENKDIYENEYDEKGNRIVRRSYHEDGSPSYKTFYKHDKRGNIIEFITYDNRDNLNNKGTYKYNSEGKLIESHSYNSQGNLSSTYRCKYDAHGNRIEGNSYNANGEHIDKSIYKYDENGNETEWSKININDGSINFSWLYVYDEKGNKVEARLINSDGEIKGKWLSVYDEHGMEIDGTHIDEDNIENRWKYEYMYDEKGNWIKQISIPVKTPYNNSASIRERVIEYYE